MNQWRKKKSGSREICAKRKIRKKNAEKVTPKPGSRGFAFDFVPRIEPLC